MRADRLKKVHTIFKLLLLHKDLRFDEIEKLTGFKLVTIRVVAGVVHETYVDVEYHKGKASLSLVEDHGMRSSRIKKVVKLHDLLLEHKSLSIDDVSSLLKVTKATVRQVVAVLCNLNLGVENLKGRGIVCLKGQAPKLDPKDKIRPRKLKRLQELYASLVENKFLKFDQIRTMFGVTYATVRSMAIAIEDVYADVEYLKGEARIRYAPEKTMHNHRRKKLLKIYDHLLSTKSINSHGIVELLNVSKPTAYNFMCIIPFVYEDVEYLKGKGLLRLLEEKHEEVLIGNMRSPAAKERRIKAIYKLLKKHKFLTIKKISKKLNISTYVVRKLVPELINQYDSIKYLKGKGEIWLTAKSGKKMGDSKSKKKKHRFTEEDANVYRRIMKGVLF